jgi:ribonuclease HI
MSDYYSPFEADKLFGSKGDATTARWTRCSVATPDLAPTQVHTYVRHAIESAKAEGDLPVMTVLLIPALAASRNPGYLQLLRANTEFCKLIMRIPAAKFRLEVQPEYMLNTSTWVKPPCDMLIIEVANRQGFERHSVTRTDDIHTLFTSRTRQALNTHLAAEHAVTESAILQYCHRAELLLGRAPTPQQRTRAAAKIRKLPQDCSPEPQPVSKPHSTTYTPQTHPLKYNWRQMAYTDGSYIESKPKSHKPENGQSEATPETSQHPEAGQTKKAARKIPLIGAAVFIPTPQPGSIMEDQEIACLPSEEAYPYDDTINRAELAAAWKAISMGCSHIATDSLAVMYQIHKMVNRPHDIHLSFHRHAALLQRVIGAIAAAGQPIHVYKVKSHIGIPSNERADEIATSVAKGKREPDEEITMSSNDRRNITWPHYPEVREPGREKVTPPQPIRDIATLHDRAHACRKCHALSADPLATKVFYSDST